MKIKAAAALAMIAASVPAHAARYLDFAINIHTSARIYEENPDADPDEPPVWDDVDFYASGSVTLDTFDPTAFTASSSLDDSCGAVGFGYSNTSIWYNFNGCPIGMSAGATFASLDFSPEHFEYHVDLTSSGASEDYTYSHYNLIGTAEGEVTSLAITGWSDTAATTPVPEPASWTLLVGGFGVVGGALRGRRKLAVSFG